MAVGTPESRPGPHRFRLVLRTALLLAFGALVYWKFDAFVQSRAVQALQDPSALWKDATGRIQARLASEPPATSQPGYSADSSTLVWSCAGALVDSCLSAFAGLDPEEKGRARADLAKGIQRFALGQVTGFTLAFTRGDSAQAALDEDNPSRLRFARATIRTRQGLFALVPGGDSASGPCLLRGDGRSECLEAPSPRKPVDGSAPPALTAGRPPAAAFTAATRSPVHAVLPGKVTALPSGPAGWLQVYHGDNLFSFYAGIAEVKTGLRIGGRVGMDDTLGFLAEPPAPDTQDSATQSATTAAASRTTPVPPVPAASLALRLEKDGAPLDPVAFLGLAADSAGSHAR